MHTQTTIRKNSSEILKIFIKNILGMSFLVDLMAKKFVYFQPAHLLLIQTPTSILCKNADE